MCCSELTRISRNTVLLFILSEQKLVGKETCETKSAKILLERSATDMPVGQLVNLVNFLHGKIKQLAVN